MGVAVALAYEKIETFSEIKSKANWQARVFSNEISDVFRDFD